MYFIGGPARVGKTTLAARLMREKQVPFIPADVLTHALDETYPQFDIRRGGWATIPDRWYRYLEKFAEYATKTLPDYCIEGDSFLPEHVARLQKRFELRACFLGNSKITLETMLRYAGHNDWVKKESEEKQQGLAEDIIRISRMYYEADAPKYGFSYFDIGLDFAAAQDRAFESLTV